MSSKYQTKIFAFDFDHLYLMGLYEQYYVGFRTLTMRTIYIFYYKEYIKHFGHSDASTYLVLTTLGPTNTESKERIGIYRIYYC